MALQNIFYVVVSNLHTCIPHVFSQKGFNALQFMGPIQEKVTV